MRVTAALLVLGLSLSLFAAEYDDCDANFIAAIGSSAYQFSPALDGELGTVRLFGILSYQRAAHEGRTGWAVWQLRIDRAADGERVLTIDGRSFIGVEGAALAELYWDGRDDSGRRVPPGRYRYTYVARFTARPVSYDAAFDAEEA